MQVTAVDIERPPAQMIRPAEVQRTTWANIAPAGATIEDVLEPGWLGAKARDMRPGDRFEIASAEHKFLIDGYIVAVDKDARTLDYVVLRVLDLTLAERVLADWSTAVVSHESGHHAWTVRIENRIAKSGFATEAAARAWLSAKQTLARYA